MTRLVFGLCGVVAAVFAIGCATDPKPVSWDEVGESAPLDRVQRKLETQADFDREAANTISAQLCEDNAREMLASSKKRGQMMMLGCLKRADFTSLLYFTQPPWKGFKFTEADYPLLLDLSMRRGGSQASEDFQQLGIKVQPFDLFLSEPEQHDAALVIARVQVLSSQQVGGEYRAKARVYTYAAESGYQRKTVTYGSGRYSSSYSYVAKENELNAVRPAGVTIELSSNEPLPKDRRFEIVARFAKTRTKALQAQRAKEANALTDSGIDPEMVADPKADPPPTIALRLVAAEKNVTSSRELEGTNQVDPTVEKYNSYDRSR
jgi:hypothetical protein